MSELLAQLVRASLPAICRDESPGFEPQSDHIRCITKFHLTLFQFASLFCEVNIRTVLGLMETSKEGQKTSHLKKSSDQATILF